MALLMSLILGSGLAAFTSNSASAQNYGYQDDYYGQSYGGDDSYYSTYPTDDKPYECRTGQFEGFFVSSVEFCKMSNSMIEKITKTEIIKQEHKAHQVHKVLKEYKVHQAQQVQIRSLFQVHKVYQELTERMELTEHKVHKVHRS